MPEMYLRLRWPDGAESVSYSPSSIIAEHFCAGERLEVQKFIDRARVALAAASDRVAERYGFACGRAAASLAELEARAARAADEPGAAVTILEVRP